MEDNSLLEAILKTFGTYVKVKDKNENVIYSNIPKKIEGNFSDKPLLKEYYVNDEHYFAVVKKIEYKGQSLILEGFQNFSTHKDLLNIDEKTDALTSKGLKVNMYSLLGNSVPLVIAIFDFDNFKKINDEYGHILADKVLSVVVELFKKNTKKKDLIARFGGDEFIAVFPYMDIEHTKKRFESIMSRLEKGIVIDGINVSITISVGMCEYDHTLSYEENMGKADVSLYYSKGDGKNKITVFEEINKLESHPRNGK